VYAGLACPGMGLGRAGVRSRLSPKRFVTLVSSAASQPASFSSARKCCLARLANVLTAYGRTSSECTRDGAIIDRANASSLHQPAAGLGAANPEPHRRYGSRCLTEYLKEQSKVNYNKSNGCQSRLRLHDRLPYPTLQGSPVANRRWTDWKVIRASRQQH